MSSTTVVGAHAGSAFERCAADALRLIEFSPALKGQVLTVPITPD